MKPKVGVGALPVDSAVGCLASSLDDEETSWADLVECVDRVEIVAAKRRHPALLVPSQRVPAQ